MYICLREREYCGTARDNEVQVDAVHAWARHALLSVHKIFCHEKQARVFLEEINGINIVYIIWSLPYVLHIYIFIEVVVNETWVVLVDFFGQYTKEKFRVFYSIYYYHFRIGFKTLHTLLPQTHSTPWIYVSVTHKTRNPDVEMSQQKSGGIIYYGLV